LRAQSFEQDLNQAWVTYSAGKYEEAVQRIRDFTNQYRGDALFPEVAKRLYYLLALSEVRLEHWGEALGAIEEFESAPGDKLEAWDEELLFWKGVALARLDRSSEAREVLGQFAEKYASSDKAFPALLLIGTSYIKEGDFGQAAEFFGKLRQRVRGTEAGRVLVLELYALLESGQNAKALAVADDGFNSLDTIPQVAGFQTLVLRLANQLAEEGSHRGAVAALVRIKSRDEILDMQNRRLELLKARLEQLKRSDEDSQVTLQTLKLIGQIEGEVDVFGKIADFDTTVRFQMASAFLSMQRFREAAFVLDGMLDRMPANAIVEAATDTLVKCYAAIRRWPKVVEVVDRFVEKFPNSEFVPGILVLKGQALQESGDYEAAIAAFEDVIARFPDNPLAANALFLKGFTRVYMGDFEEAEQIFSEVVEKYPDHEIAEKALFWQGQALSMGRKHEEAIPAMERYLEKYPSGEFATEARYRIAFSNEALSKFDVSIPMLEAFIAEHPQDANTPEAMMLLGDAKMAQGDIEEGIAILEKVPAGVGTYREEAWFKTGKAYRVMEDWERMREHFQKFQDDFPKSARLAEAVYWEGKAWPDNPEEARKVYWEALERFGDDPAQWGVSEIVGGLEKLYPDADSRAEYGAKLEELADKAEAAGKRTLEARAKWALAQFYAKDSPEKSRELLVEIAPLMDPKTSNPVMLADVADALRLSGQMDEAATLYRDLRRWNPLSPSRDRVFKGLGLIALERGESDKALEWFNRLMRETPDSKERASVLIEIADLQLAAGNREEAIARLEELLGDKRVPRSQKVEALFKLGEIYMAGNDPKRAVAYYQRIYVLYGAYTEFAARAYVRSGLAFEQLDDPVAAARTYTEFLELERMKDLPEVQPLREEAERRLAALPEEARKSAEQLDEAAALAEAEEEAAQ